LVCAVRGAHEAAQQRRSRPTLCQPAGMSAPSAQKPLKSLAKGRRLKQSLNIHSTTHTHQELREGLVVVGLHPILLACAVTGACLIPTTLLDSHILPTIPRHGHSPGGCCRIRALHQREPGAQANARGESVRVRQRRERVFEPAPPTLVELSKEDGGRDRVGCFGRSRGTPLPRWRLLHVIIRVHFL
jgi:hypothetical protein